MHLGVTIPSQGPHAGRWVTGRLVWLARLAARSARGGDGELPDAVAEAMDLAEEAARTARGAGAMAAEAAADYWAADGPVQARPTSGGTGLLSLGVQPQLLLLLQSPAHGATQAPLVCTTEGTV